MSTSLKCKQKNLWALSSLFFPLPEGWFKSTVSLCLPSKKVGVLGVHISFEMLRNTIYLLRGSSMSFSRMAHIKVNLLIGFSCFPTNMNATQLFQQQFQGNQSDHSTSRYQQKQQKYSVTMAFTEKVIIYMSYLCQCFTYDLIVFPILGIFNNHSNILNSHLTMCNPILPSLQTL